MPDESVVSLVSGFGVQVNYSTVGVLSAIRKAKQDVSLETSLNPSWQRALDFGESVVEDSNFVETLRDGSSAISSDPRTLSNLDPSALVKNDLSFVVENMTRLSQSGHPLLNTVATYYYRQKGKNFRPLVVLLLSKAMNSTQFISNRQRRLAEVTEMIHTASLFHDDVIDGADARRSLPSVNAAFGNKMAILGGDFLLARASVALARLNSNSVTQLMAQSIACLVEGEFMQLKPKSNDALKEDSRCNTLLTEFTMLPASVRFESLLLKQYFCHYIKKTYMKTASLVSKSCEASAILGDHSTAMQISARQFGEHLGLAFQLMDDVLDFTSDNSTLGKPAAADLKLGLATAPVLFAANEDDSLLPLIQRQFKEKGDVDIARAAVLKGNYLEQTKSLAKHHCEQAIHVIRMLPSSQSKDALVEIVYNLLTRVK